MGKMYTGNADINQEMPVLIESGKACRFSGMNPICERIDEALKKKGMKPYRLAKELGITPQSVYEWVREGKPPDRKRMKEIARVLEVSPAWLEFGDQPQIILGGKAKQDSSSPILSIKGSPRKEIPVVGTTQGGPDHHWEELGYPTGWGEEYAVIESDDPHAYLLRVEGESMSPRINAGEYVLVEPSIEAQPGDTVVVRMVSGEVMLKYFRADYGDEIALESHNHGFTLKTVKKADIVFIHQVSGTLYRRKIKKRV